MPSTPFKVALPKSEYHKMRRMLRAEMKMTGLSLRGLSKAMGVSPAFLSQFLSGECGAGLRVLAFLGLRVVIEPGKKPRLEEVEDGSNG